MYYSRTNNFILSSLEKFKALGLSELKFHTAVNIGTSYIVYDRYFKNDTNTPCLVFMCDERTYALSKEKIIGLTTNESAMLWRKIHNVNLNTALTAKEAVVVEDVDLGAVDSIETLINAHKKLIYGYALAHVNGYQHHIIDVKLFRETATAFYSKRMAYALMPDSDSIIFAIKRGKAVVIIVSEAGLRQTKIFTTEEVSKIIRGITEKFCS